MFALLASALVLIVAWFVFHNLGALLAAVVASMLSALWGLGALSLAGGKLDILKTALPTLALVIGLTDAVHLVVHMRHLRAAGAGPVGAASAAIREIGLACMLTSFTTAVGFGSLAVGRVQMIQGFGIATAGAVVLTFVAVLTTTPLIASAARDLGRRRTSRLGARLERLADRGITVVVRHAGAVSAAGLAATAALLAVALQLEPDNRLTELTPRHRESFRAIERIDRELGGSAFAAVVVEWPAGLSHDSPEVIAAVEKVSAALDGVPEFAGTRSWLDLLALLPGSREAAVKLLPLLPEELVRRFLRPDLRRALVSTRFPDLPSARAERAADAVEAALSDIRARHPGLEVHLTGTVVVARRNIDDMITDLALGLGLAAVIIFAVLSLTLRSLLLGLVTLIPNALPLVFAAALLAALGQPLQMASAVSFTILLAIAVDDTIHLITRFRRELAVDGDVDAAIRRSVLRVGSALLLTTVALLAGVCIFFASEIPTNRLFSLVLAVGFLMALVGDLVILPALLVFSVRSRLGRPWLRRVTASVQNPPKP